MTQRPPSPTLSRHRRAARGSAILVLALGFCLPLGLGACSSSDEVRTELTKTEKLGLYYENALWYIEMGDLDRAQFQAEKALEIDPGNERFELIYARTNVMRGTSASIEEALRVLEANPERPDYRWQMTLGAALERKGVIFDEAARGVRDGQRATRAADRQVRGDELQAEARDYWVQARKRFERALELPGPGEIEALGGLVRTNALLEDFEVSVKWAEELLESIQETQALKRAQLESPDLSADREAQIRDAYRKDRGFEVKTRLHAATVLRRLGRQRDALVHIDEIVALEPELAQAYSMRGQLLMELDEYVKARAALQQFLDLTDLPFDDAQIRRTFDLQDECERRLRAR
jgi:tetratricopeptide (TPR) repeat protein